MFVFNAYYLIGMLFYRLQLKKLNLKSDRGNIKHNTRFMEHGVHIGINR